MKRAANHSAALIILLRRNRHDRSLKCCVIYKVAHRTISKSVVYLFSVAACSHHLLRTHEIQLVRHCRFCHGEIFSHFADVAFAILKEQKHADACRVANYPEEIRDFHDLRRGDFFMEFTPSAIKAYAP